MDGHPGAGRRRTEPRLQADSPSPPLTVTARDVLAFGGQPIPSLPVAYSGFAPGQTLATSGVTGAPSCSTTATPASPSGAYPITCTAGSLQSANYSFTLAPGTLTMDAGARFVPLSPTRIQDSRPGSNVGPHASPWGPGQTREITVTGGQVPTDADAVVLNATVTNTSASSHLRIWPTGTTLPTVSNLNWQTGWTIPNAVTVKVGTNGKINIYNHNGNADVIIDVVGYYRAGSGVAFHPLTPVRIQDSRPGSKVGPYSSPWSATTTRDLTAVAAGVPSHATAVLMNATVTGTSASSHLRIWPAGTTLPTVSNLNWQTGWTIPNAVTVKVGTNGKINIYNHNGNADVIADLAGWFG
jgi:hypothetical protein